MPPKCRKSGTVERSSVRNSPRPLVSRSYTGGSSQGLTFSFVSAPEASAGQGIRSTPILSSSITAKRISLSRSTRHSSSVACPDNAPTVGSSSSTSPLSARCSPTASLLRISPANASTRMICGSPTRNRRIDPLTTATFIVNATTPAPGSSTSANCCIARCIASAQAVALYAAGVSLDAAPPSS